jgi:hypothetical protein
MLMSLMLRICLRQLHKPLWSCAASCATGSSPKAMDELLQQLQALSEEIHNNKVLLNEQKLLPAKKLSLKQKAARVTQLQHQLGTLKGQLAAAMDDAAMKIPDYAVSLQSLGEVLCAQHPSRFCCNNPRCSNFATASEAFLLVRGKACACGGCLGGSRRPALAPTFCMGAR